MLRLDLARRPVDGGQPQYVENGGALLEEWSVVYPSLGGAPDVKLLAAQGWGPFGAPPPPEMAIAPNRVTLDTFVVGGVGAAVSDRRVIRLSPLSLRAETESAVGRTQPFANRSEWSWDEFAGAVSWFNAECLADGGSPGDLEWTSAEPDSGPPPGGEAYVFIPQVSIDDGTFGVEGWKTTDLGRCGALVDTSGTHGFLLHGSKGDAGDAAMRILALGSNDFLVELRDRAWGSHADAGSNEDQLEVWASREEPQRCPHEAGAKEWCVRLSDGGVVAGVGKPSVAGLTVLRVHDGETLRLKLHLAPPPAAVAFAYGGSSAGVLTKRVMATSRIRSGDAASLGVVRVIPRKDATCRVVEKLDASGDAASRRRLEPLDTVGPPTPYEP